MKGTSETPGVLLDGMNGTFEISGRALVTDARTFFKPAIEWLQEYSKAPRPITRLTIKLEYLNNESSKVILDILTVLEKINGASVHWYFKEDDEDMEEAGEELAELVNIPFEFRTY